MELREYVLGVLRDAYVLSLGVSDADGVWVSDVTYVYDDDYNLYWVSQPTARHSGVAGTGAQVAGTIHAGVHADAERAIQLSGTLAVLEGPQPDLVQKLNAKIGSGKSYTVEGLLAGGLRWYKLTPTRIELHHSDPFGWNRQKVL